MVQTDSITDATKTRQVHTGHDLQRLINAALMQHGGVWSVQQDSKRYIVLGDITSDRRLEVRLDDNDHPIVFDAATQQRIQFATRASFMALWKMADSGAQAAKAQKRQPRRPVITPYDKFATLRDKPFDWLGFADAMKLAPAVAKAFLAHHVKVGDITDIGGGLYAIAQPANTCRALMVLPPRAIVPARKAAPVFAVHFLRSVWEQYAPAETFASAPVFAPAPF